MATQYEKYKETYRNYYITHKEEILERKREYRVKHPDYEKKWWKNYYSRNKEVCRERLVNWRKKNPEKTRVYRLISNHPARYPLENDCVFCGTTKNLEHTHLDYEDKGFNYVTACHTCNCWMVKGNTWLLKKVKKIAWVCLFRMRH